MGVLVGPKLPDSIFFYGQSTYPALVTTFLVSCFRYGFEGVILTIYALERGELECKVDNCPFKDPTKILEVLDVGEAKLYIDFIVLGIFFVILRLVAYLILKYKVKSER